MHPGRWSLQQTGRIRALWENLKETLTGIGWDDLVKFDMEKYQKVIDARKAAK